MNKQKQGSIKSKVSQKKGWSMLSEKRQMKNGVAVVHVLSSPDENAIIFGNYNTKNSNIMDDQKVSEEEKERLLMAHVEADVSEDLREDARDLETLAL